MARGRKTGGRQPGSKNKAPEALRLEIEASGETPLQYMLRVMRDQTQDWDRRDKMAAAAAPYVHAKLANVEHSGSIDLGLGERLQHAKERVEQDYPVSTQH